MARSPRRCALHARIGSVSSGARITVRVARMPLLSARLETRIVRTLAPSSTRPLAVVLAARLIIAAVALHCLLLRHHVLPITATLVVLLLTPTIRGRTITCVIIICSTAILLRFVLSIPLVKLTIVLLSILIVRVRRTVHRLLGMLRRVLAVVAARRRLIRRVVIISHGSDVCGGRCEMSRQKTAGPSAQRSPVLGLAHREAVFASHENAVWSAISTQVHQVSRDVRQRWVKC